MKKLVLLTLLIFSLTKVYSQSGFEWARVCGHPYYGETKSMLAPGEDGSFLMAGNYIDTAAFGDLSVISSGETDIFIASHSSEGECQWVISDGGSNYDYLHGIASTENSIYTGGAFYGTTNLSGEEFSSLGSQDIYIARYDTEGSFLWAKHIGSPKTDYLNAIACDPEGNIILTGHFYDSIAFGDTSIYALAGSDIFLAKYDPMGELLWVAQAGGSSADQSYTMDCHANGNILFTGSFFYDIQIGDTLLSTLDPTGVFYAQYSPAGDFLSVVQADGNGLTAKSFATYGQDGNIFFTGNFTDEVKFGPYIFNAGAFNIDIFISSFSAEGELLWADHGQGAGSDQLMSVSKGPFNDFYISGHFLDTLHFGDLTLDYTLCCGSAEIFLVRYTANGSPSWGEQISGQRGMVESIFKNEQDELFVSGIFQYELEFGEIILESTYEYSNFLCGVSTGTYTGFAENNPIAQPLEIYPNPARNTITIKMEKSSTRARADILDMRGKILISEEVLNGQSMDISTIPPGLYLLKLTDEQTMTSQTGKIIKR